MSVCWSFLQLIHFCPDIFIGRPFIHPYNNPENCFGASASDVAPIAIGWLCEHASDDESNHAAPEFQLWKTWFTAWESISCLWLEAQDVFQAHPKSVGSEV